MTDIATLGFAVDTSGLEKGAKALDDISAKGKEAASSAKEVGDSFSEAGSKAGDLKTGLGSASSSTNEFTRAQQSAKGIMGEVRDSFATTKSSISQYSDAIKATYDAQGQFTTQQARVVRGLEDQVVAQQLSGQSLATYTALRRAGTTADTEAGRIITTLVAAQYEGVAVTNSWRNAWGLLGPAVTGTTGALNAHAPAARGVQAAHLGASAASRETALEMRALAPVLNEAGIAMSGLSQFAFAARGGFIGLGAAITGTIIVALETAADAIRHFELDLAALGGSKATGTAAFAGLKEAADQSGVSLGTLAGSFGQLLIAQQKYQSAQGVVFVPGAAGAVDAITKVEKAFGDMGRIADASDTTIAKVSNTIATSLANSGKLTAQAFQQVINESPAMAAAIAKAYNGQTIAQFMQTVASGQVTYSKFVDAIGRAEPALKQQADDTVPGMTRAWNDFKAAVERAEAAQGSAGGVAALLTRTKNSLDEVTAGTKTWYQALMDVDRLSITFSGSKALELWKADLNSLIGLYDDLVPAVVRVGTQNKATVDVITALWPLAGAAIKSALATSLKVPSNEVGNLDDWKTFYTSLDAMNKKAATDFASPWGNVGEQIERAIKGKLGLLEKDSEVGNLDDWKKFYASLDELDKQSETGNLADWQQFFQSLGTEQKAAADSTGSVWDGAAEKMKGVLRSILGVATENNKEIKTNFKNTADDIGGAFNDVPGKVDESFGSVAITMQKAIGTGVDGSIVQLDRLINAAQVAANAVAAAMASATNSANAAANSAAHAGGGSSGSGSGDTGGSVTPTPTFDYGSGNLNSLLDQSVGNFAKGGIGYVPPGYKNDSYRAMLNVESGEQIIVKPKDKSISQVLSEARPIHLGSFASGGVASLTNSGADVSRPDDAKAIAAQTAAALSPAAATVQNTVVNIASPPAPVDHGAIGVPVSASPLLPDTSILQSFSALIDKLTQSLPKANTGSTIDAAILPQGQNTQNLVTSFSDEYNKLGITRDDTKTALSGAGDNKVPDVIRVSTVQIIGAMRLGHDVAIAKMDMIVTAINNSAITMSTALTNSVNSISTVVSNAVSSMAATAGGTTTASGPTTTGGTTTGPIFNPTIFDPRSPAPATGSTSGYGGTGVVFSGAGSGFAADKKQQQQDDAQQKSQFSKAMQDWQASIAATNKTEAANAAAASKATQASSQTTGVGLTAQLQAQQSATGKLDASAVWPPPFNPDTSIADMGVDYGYATGSFGIKTVPSGHPGDTFGIRMKSGEQYAVAPPGQSLRDMVMGHPPVHLGDYAYGTMDRSSIPYAVTPNFDDMIQSVRGRGAHRAPEHNAAAAQPRAPVNINMTINTPDANSFIRSKQQILNETNKGLGEAIIHR